MCEEGFYQMECCSCDLYNKKYEISENISQSCDIMWVGVSLKKCMKIEEALGVMSASGSILKKIEEENP